MPRIADFDRPRFERSYNGLALTMSGGCVQEVYS
jgi:hypothetical protein